jgi:hypothetical protein
LPQLATQLYKFLAFAGAQSVGLGWRSATGIIGHAHPVQDAGRVSAKLFGQFAMPPACAHQLDHLLTKLSWAGRLEIGYRGLLLKEQ